MESNLFFSVTRPHCKDLRAYILKRRVNKDIGQPWKLSRWDLQRHIFRGAPGCDLVSRLSYSLRQSWFLATKHLNYKQTPCLLIPWIPRPIREDMASLPDAVRKELTNRAASGAYRSRKIKLVLYLYTHPCRVCEFERAPERRLTSNFLGLQTWGLQSGLW